MSWAIYVMTSRRTRAVKLGIAGDPLDRLNTIRRKLGDPTVRLYDYVRTPYARGIERDLLCQLTDLGSHRGVSPPHGGGDWFLVKPEGLAREIRRCLRNAENARQFVKPLSREEIDALHGRVLRLQRDGADQTITK